MTLTETHLKNCLNEISDCCGIEPPTLEALRPIVESDRELVGVLVAYYSKPDCGLDTQDRELLTGAIARHFVGRSWPTYGDGDAIGNAFYATLRENASKAGWFVQK